MGRASACGMNVSCVRGGGEGDAPAWVDVPRLLGHPLEAAPLKVRVEDVALAAAVKGRRAHKQREGLSLLLPCRLERGRRGSRP